MPQQQPWLGFDQPGAIQAIGGLILGLIALFTSYDRLTLPALDLPIPQPWGIPLIAASVATVFGGLCNTARHIGATLKWRRDPGFEQRMLRYEQSRLLHEQRMQQLRSEIEQIERETEQLRRANARGRALLNSIDQLCFAPDSSSNPIAPTGSDCGSSLNRWLNRRWRMGRPELDRSGLADDIRSDHSRSAGPDLGAPDPRARSR